MIKISSDIPGRIKVVFPYNPDYIAKIKTVKAHRWHPEEKCWSFPYSKPFLKEILSAFTGEEFEIDPSLQTLISQNEKEKSNDHRAWQRKPLSSEVEERGKEKLEWESNLDKIGENPLFNRVRDLIRLKNG